MDTGGVRLHGNTMRAPLRALRAGDNAVCRCRGSMFDTDKGWGRASGEETAWSGRGRGHEEQDGRAATRCRLHPRITCPSSLPVPRPASHHKHTRLQANVDELDDAAILDALLADDWVRRTDSRRRGGECVFLGGRGGVATARRALERRGGACVGEATRERQSRETGCRKGAANPPPKRGVGVTSRVGVLRALEPPL